MKNRIAFVIALGSLAACGQAPVASNLASDHTPAVVEFHIPAGTGAHGWNTEATIIEVKVGDTLRVTNDDSVNHQLHTNGRPCEHGTLIRPRGTYDCVIGSTYDAAINGAIYDHFTGPSAQVWVRATN